jgi:hypothetical protein
MPDTKNNTVSRRGKIDAFLDVARFILTDRDTDTLRAD